MSRPVFKSYEARIETGFAHLWGYVKEHGTARVPRSYTSPDGYRLGNWIHRRRECQGRDPRLDRLLESLPGWTWAPFEQRFEENVRCLEAAIESDRLAGDRALMGWLSCQRVRARSGRLAQERLERLQRAGVL